MLRRAGLAVTLALVVGFGRGMGASSAPGNTSVDARSAREEAGSVYLDTLLADTTLVRPAGPAPLEARAGLLNGRIAQRALWMAPDGLKPADAVASVTVRLNRAYARFRSLVGRDDAQEGNGMAPAYFEVWGDGSLLFRSAPLCARNAPRDVAVAGARIGREPREIDVSVRGMTSMRLVARYAVDTGNGSDARQFARGCVWAAARLLPAEPDPAGDRVVALRARMREAVARVAARVVSVAGEAVPPLRLPLSLFVAPTPVTQGDTGTDDPVRAALEDLLPLAQTGGGAPVFSVKNRGRRRGRKLKADDPSDSALRDEARRIGADYLLQVTLETTTERDTGIRYTIRIRDARDGTPLVAFDSDSTANTKN